MITTNVRMQVAQAEALDAAIRQNLEELGYGE
jgi:hypothetical protein